MMAGGTMKARIASKKSAKLTEMMDETIKALNDETYLNRSRKRQQDFTRKRKLPFKSLMLFILNQSRCSTQCALECFFDLVGKSETFMRQQSFSDARQKIKWEAFHELFARCTNVVYSDKHSWNTWHGYTVMAVDGSKAQLPSDPLLLAEFGGMGPGTAAPTAQSSYLYDVLNDIVVDARIACLSTDERTLAKQHLERLREFPAMKKKLLVFDRGYPSAELISAIQDAGCEFLFRVRAKFDVQIDALALGIHDFALAGKAGETLNTKVIKLMLDSGETETLITSIRDKRMGVEAFKALYFKRWGVETKIGELKHSIETENFSGRTKETIFQDFFVSMYLANMIAVAAHDAQPVIDFATAEHENKYTYKVNKNHAIGAFKDRFIAAALEENQRKRNHRIKQIINLIAKGKTPERFGRSVPRNPSPRQANFYHNRKSNA
jgi:hypothetical protein